MSGRAPALGCTRGSRACKHGWPRGRCIHRRRRYVLPAHRDIVPGSSRTMHGCPQMMSRHADPLRMTSWRALHGQLQCGEAPGTPRFEDTSLRVSYHLGGRIGGGADLPNPARTRSRELPRRRGTAPSAADNCQSLTPTPLLLRTPSPFRILPTCCPRRDFRGSA